MRQKGKGKAMNPKESPITGHKARRETEDFLNRHISDQAKGWPVLSRLDTNSTQSRQTQQPPKTSRILMVFPKEATEK